LKARLARGGSQDGVLALLVQQKEAGVIKAKLVTNEVHSPVEQFFQA